MRVDVFRRVLAVEDLQPPRQRRLPAVELLVEVVTEPTDGLRQDDSRGDRISEGWKRDAAAPAAYPRADGTQRHRAPNSQTTVPDPQCRAESGAAGAPVGAPVRGQVIKPATDQSERHRPQRDVVDHAALAAT